MSLDSAINHLLAAKRISAASQSYAKDNPGEWAKVKAYLEGGTRPTGVATEMGLGLIEVEDERRGGTPPPPTGWTKVANEWQSFTLSQNSEVRFGTGTKWNTKVLAPGTYECSYHLFGDPAVGAAKTCEARPSSTPPPPAGNVAMSAPTGTVGA